MSDRPTKERILDAAEELFADRGFGASLRQITAEAGVNLAAVNYHFGSKDALIGEVFARRLQPLNEERFRILEAFEKNAGPDGPLLEQIVEAFIGPPIRMSRQPRGEVAMRLFGQTMGQRDDVVRHIFTEQFRTVVGRFLAALTRALPEHPPEEVVWKLMFTVGAMAHTCAISDKLPAIVHGKCKPAGVETTVRRLVPFVTAGLRASTVLPVLETKNDA